MFVAFIGFSFVLHRSFRWFREINFRYRGLEVSVTSWFPRAFPQHWAEGGRGYFTVHVHERKGERWIAKHAFTCRLFYIKTLKSRWLVTTRIQRRHGREDDSQSSRVHTHRFATQGDCELLLLIRTILAVTRPISALSRKHAKAALRARQNICIRQIHVSNPYSSFNSWNLWEILWKIAFPESPCAGHLVQHQVENWGTLGTDITNAKVYVFSLFLGQDFLENTSRVTVGRFFGSSLGGFPHSYLASRHVRRVFGQDFWLSSVARFGAYRITPTRKNVCWSNWNAKLSQLRLLLFSFFFLYVLENCLWCIEFTAATFQYCSVSCKRI